MIITADSLEKYMILLFAVTGEIRYENLLEREFKKDSSSYSRSYQYITVRELISDKKIRMSSDSLGGNYLRLSEPKGTDELKSISKEAFRAFEILAGKKSSGHYKGSRDQKEKRKIQSEICFLFEKIGVSINGITLKLCEGEDSLQNQSVIRPETVFERDGEGLLTRSEIFDRYDCGSTFYLTTHVLDARRNNETFNPKEILSRKFGLLYSKGRAFLVYCPGTEAYRWSKDTEKFMKEYYERELKPLLKEGRVLEALFLIPNEKIMDAFINPKRHDKSLCQPAAVFDSVYLVPMYERPEDYLSILLAEDGEDKFYQIGLPKDYVRGFDYQGLIGERRIYSFLTGNLSAMIKARNEAEKPFILVHPWQYENILAFFRLSKEEAEGRVFQITKEDFTECISKIQEETCSSSEY